MNRLPVETKNKTYDIVIYNTFEHILDEIKKLSTSFSKIAIISDDQVGPLYANEVKCLLEKGYCEVCCYTFKHGENNKHLGTISDFYTFMIDNNLDRKSLLIALGGGVTGDMVGFAAATYMRGIRFVQIPTSLLAQVDSSIGGKTGVDFNGYKNIVGAFYQPELVYVNIQTLKTLPQKEFNSGMGEVLKHGMILDDNYLRELIEQIEKIRHLDEAVLTQMILRSCQIKSKIVSEDEKEEGSRALLNFGHTAGHAIERLKNFELLHGECISIGFMVALHISQLLGHISQNTVFEMEQLLKQYDLPTTVAGLDSRSIYQEMFHDKKTIENQLNFILLKSMGVSFIHKCVPKEDVINALEKVIQK